MACSFSKSEFDLVEHPVIFPTLANMAAFANEDDQTYRVYSLWSVCRVTVDGQGASVRRLSGATDAVDACNCVPATMRHFGDTLFRHSRSASLAIPLSFALVTVNAAIAPPRALLATGHGAWQAEKGEQAPVSESGYH